MSGELVKVFLVLVYLVAGTVGIALLVSWALKRFGSSEQQPSEMSASDSK